MSLREVSLLKWSPVELISSGKYSLKITKVPLLSRNYEKNKLEFIRRSSGKMGLTTSLQQTGSPLKVESADGNVNGGGIGIHDFFQGTNIFLTGATGLLGKVLVEKLLRSTSVGKIYVLVKANDKEAALDRLSKEVMESELLESIREKHGNSYKEFIGAKLMPVVGNICEPNMGMDPDSANSIMEEVDVIIGSAANTDLNGRYDFLLDANVNAPQRLLRFAKRCKNLKLFVHISTAYVNGKREGIIYEKPQVMREHIRDCNDDDSSSSSLCPWLDLTDEINLAMKSLMASSNAAKDLKMLGQNRAAFYGWNNSYTMTKALGEMVVNEIREDVPVLIIRPSIIESSYKEPLPGWIQGKRMTDPMLISYGKGQLPAYLANPEVIVDIIPVDIVANTIIAAIAKHGNVHKSRELNVYHVASSVTNPVTISDVFEYVYEYFKETPLVESTRRVSRVRFFDNFNDFSKYTRHEIFRSCNRSLRQRMKGQDEKMIDQKIQNQSNAISTYAEQMCKMYFFGGFFNARFDAANTKKLMDEMSKMEQLEFEVDTKNIDWKKYFQEIHVAGVRKYVIGNSGKASI